MSYKTLEVELEHGQVRTQAAEDLPAKARALLTILELHSPEALQPVQVQGRGLHRFLARQDFPLTAEQFSASMTSDYWEQ